MQHGGDAGEPVLPLSSSGVVNATAAAAASADDDVPLPPPGAASLNSSLNNSSSLNSEVSPQVSDSKLSNTNKKKASKAIKPRLPAFEKSAFEDAVRSQGVQKKSMQNTQKKSPQVPGSSDDTNEIDVEMASHTSGLSRPSSRASHASSFTGLETTEDFIAKYNKMKLMLMEKEKELQKVNDLKAQEPTAQGVFPQMFGKKMEAKAEEEEVLLEPPDPAQILAQVRRRRLAALVLIFAGMCTLPVLLVQSFQEEITP